MGEQPDPRGHNMRPMFSGEKERKETAEAGELLTPQLGRVIEDILRQAPNYASDPDRAELTRDDGRFRLQAQRALTSDLRPVESQKLVSMQVHDFEEGADVYLTVLGDAVHQLTMKVVSTDPDDPGVFDGGSAQNQELACSQLRHMFEEMGFPLPPGEISLP